MTDLEHFTFETDPDPADVEELETRLNKFNLDTTGIPFGGLLACFRKNERGEITAGIWGFCWGGCAEIRYLWVEEGCRRQRIGSALLREAEREALRRGCSQVILDTHSFQAPDFYARHGYELIGVVADYPRGHRKLYFRKSLADPTNQAAGKAFAP